MDVAPDRQPCQCHDMVAHRAALLHAVSSGDCGDCLHSTLQLLTNNDQLLLLRFLHGVTSVADELARSFRGGGTMRCAFVGYHDYGEPDHPKVRNVHQTCFLLVGAAVNEPSAQSCS